MSTLEAQLTALTQEFVAKLVDAIRNASFAEVAGLSTHRLAQPAEKRGGARRPAPSPRTNGGGGGAGAGAGRQTAARRAELGDRIVSALRGATSPLGVRALANELSVPADVLAVPLRELRAAGKVRKHGEKRSTTYSAA
jgi:hypothetical protein